MSNFGSTAHRERNPVTYQRHRRQVLRQITIPLVIGIIFVVILVGLTLAATWSQTSLWADISIIWLIIPAFILSVLATILLVGLTYGCIMLIRNLPYYSNLLHGYVFQVVWRVKKVNDVAVEPILRLEGLKASTRRLVYIIRRK